MSTKITVVSRPDITIIRNKDLPIPRIGEAIKFTRTFRDPMFLEVINVLYHIDDYKDVEVEVRTVIIHPEEQLNTKEC